MAKNIKIGDHIENIFDVEKFVEIYDEVNKIIVNADTLLRSVTYTTLKYRIKMRQYRGILESVEI